MGWVGLCQAPKCDDGVKNGEDAGWIAGGVECSGMNKANSKASQTAEAK